MIVLGRLFFTVALVYGFWEAGANARMDPHSGDLTNAFWLSFCVIMAIGAAFCWAPLFVGRLMANSLTSPLTSGHYQEPHHRLLGLIRWCENRRFRRAVCGLCFLEGVRRPWQPVPFVIGVRNARPGSWLEKVFAEEVYRSYHTAECIKAREILRRHGVEPPPHAVGSVRLILDSLDRETAPDKPPLPVPAAVPPSLQRNPRVTLFGDQPPTSPAGSDATDPPAKG